MNYRQCTEIVRSGYRKGQRCRSAPQEGSTLCFSHNPANIDAVVSMAKKSQESRLTRIAEGRLTISQEIQQRNREIEKEREEKEKHRSLDILIYEVLYLQNKGWSEERLIAFITGRANNNE